MHNELVHFQVDDDMERHNELLVYVKENEENIETVVAKRRKDFTNDFFRHLELLYQANYQQLDQQHGKVSRVSFTSWRSFENIFTSHARFEIFFVKVNGYSWDSEGSSSLVANCCAWVEFVGLYRKVRYSCFATCFISMPIAVLLTYVAVIFEHHYHYGTCIMLCWKAPSCDTASSVTIEIRTA